MHKLKSCAEPLNVARPSWISRLPQALNVMTFIQRAEKDIKGFESRYAALSDIAHPNWRGTALLYSRSR